MTPLFASPQHVRAFAAALRTRALGKQIQYLEQTGSTNDGALHAAAAGAPHGAVFITEAQSAGRGRRGRSWESPPGLSLLFSVLLRPERVVPADLGWIPLAAGLACVESVNAACGVAAALKWPNDIVAPCSAAPGWRKLGGVLCESLLSGTPDGAGSFVVAGIGLNVNQLKGGLPRVAKAPPSSLRLEAGKIFDRQRVLCQLLENLERRFEALSAPQYRAALKRDVHSRLARWWTPRRTLVVQNLAADAQGAPLEGSFAELDDFGRLKLKFTGGAECILADAEVLKVRG